MSRGVLSVRTCAAALLVAASFWGTAPAQAQTTVVLDAPDAETTDTTIRGGSYASTNFDGQPLATRASSNATYVRRALLKFDTSNSIPYKATIQSATLRLTVKGGNAETRRLSAYRVSSSFEEEDATWVTRKAGYRWSQAGGDLGAKYAEATASGTPGSTVTFDVTRLVQETVDGTYGSRYTRIAIVDQGASSRESYREFYPSEADDPRVRPVLTVVYGGTSSAIAPPAPATTTGATLKVLHWNVHHGGVRTDGVTDRDGLTDWMASFDADVFSLNELDSLSNLTDIVSRLKAKTGKTWYYSYDYGIAVVSRFPIDSKSSCVINDSIGRKAVQARIVVNGRAVNVFSVHLDAYSASTRQIETKNLLACAAKFPEQRIIAGDFNAQPSSTEIGYMKQDYTDAWAVAKSLGTAYNYDGNCDGCTRRSRIDYVFTSRGASALVLQSARIFDTRDPSGVQPSDHKPLMVTYAVK